MPSRYVERIKLRPGEGESLSVAPIHLVVTPAECYVTAFSGSHTPEDVKAFLREIGEAVNGIVQANPSAAELIRTAADVMEAGELPYLTP